MPAFSFAKAKEQGLLNEKELERFAILYMAMHEEIKPTNTHFMIAAPQSGNTVGSFRESLRLTMKKLKEKECYVDDDGNGGAVPPTPAATPKKAAGRKRKADAGEGGGPVSKKATRGGKKTPEVEGIKKETGEDESSEVASPDEI